MRRPGSLELFGVRFDVVFRTVRKRQFRGVLRGGELAELGFEGADVVALVDELLDAGSALVGVEGGVQPNHVVFVGQAPFHDAVVDAQFG